MRILIALLTLLPGLAWASVPLYWTPVVTNTDHTPITGAVTYSIYQGPTGNETTKIQTGITGLSALISSGLTPGTQACFIVVAVVAGIEGIPSNEVCSTIGPEIPGSTTLRGAP